MPKGRSTVLTLDVGTSSVRAIVSDSRAVPFSDGEVRIAYRPRVAADGTAEMGADDLARHCVDAISGALRALRRGDEVVAVGFSSFWHGLLGLDSKDRPSIPLMLWSDTRSWREARALAEELDGDAVRRRTGAPVHPSYWPAKLAWLKRERPQGWGTTARWVSFADYLYLQLFGELGTSASMASGTGLHRLDGGWDGELLERLGVDVRQLAPFAEEMCELRPPFHDRWPRLARSPWLTARGDGALANLGSDCDQPRRRALTVGTSAALRAVTTERVDLAPGLWCYLVEPGRYLVGGSFSNGGNLHEWLLRTLRIDERRLERSLRRLPPASSQLTFLPLLSGERSPGFAAHAFGALARLTAATTAEDVARSGMEAVALEVAAADRALDATVPGAERLLASGGGLTRSAAWCQVMADAIGKPLSTLPVEEASSRGAAIVALARAGSEAPRRLAIKRTFQPRPEAQAAYQEAYRQRDKLYGALIQTRTFEDSPVARLPTV